MIIEESYFTLVSSPFISENLFVWIYIVVSSNNNSSYNNIPSVSIIQNSLMSYIIDVTSIS